ncbi:hypothetical protein KSP40_PGU006129 [Platanthera guangdongensis]|uniref:Ribosome maturation factor RimM n=1 Tax=Platanthera guangdongensis TaxID=2320717 RepID=A0ABR2MJB9_9ASPA
MLPSPVSPSPSPHTLPSSRRSFFPCPAASALNFFGTASNHALCHWRRVSPPLCAAGPRAIAEVVTGTRKDAKEEEDLSDLKFIDVGFISSVHGLKGELRVKPNTGFPELRFCKPGKRWLRARILGRETISEVQLTRGRNHPGQKCWIISFEGVDTVDKAKQMVGSKFLVWEGDRPELQEDEFYTHDLVGMRVIMKETGTLVGTVTNVVNSGANDLLYVMRSSSDTCKNPLDHSDSRMPEKRTDASGQFVWIPFVEAIVPEVDKERREMIITPPKGLLELNLRSDTRSKKERHQMEWKQRKKLHHRLNVAKKALHEMGQSHLLDGFSIGEKDQKDKLARKIVNANLRLFQHAVQSVGSSSTSDICDCIDSKTVLSVSTTIDCGPSFVQMSLNILIDVLKYETRLSLFDFVGANSNLLLKNALKIPHKYLLDCAYSEKNSELFKEGLQLLRNSKAAIILFVNDDRSFGEFAHHKLQKLLFDYRRFLKFVIEIYNGLTERVHKYNQKKVEFVRLLKLCTSLAWCTFMFRELLLAMIFIKGLHSMRMLTHGVFKLVFRELLLAMIFINGLHSVSHLTRDFQHVFHELLLAMISLNNLHSMVILA